MLVFKLIEESAQSIKKMESKIDTDKMKAPSFLMVLTGVGGYAYRRKEQGCNDARDHDLKRRIRRISDHIYR